MGCLTGVWRCRRWGGHIRLAVGTTSEGSSLLPEDKNTHTLLTQLVQLSNLHQRIPLHIAMVGWRMMFCKIICQVCLTGLPINLKSPLLFPIQQPFKLHIHQFCTLWPDSGLYYPLCCGIIRLDGSTWLGVTHLMQNAFAYAQLPLHK